jgi:hypothetical protein
MQNNYSVPLSGFTTLFLGSPCTDCASLNNTRIVQWSGMDKGIQGGCCWKYIFDPPICGVGQVQLILNCGAESAEWQLYLTDADGSETLGYWNADVPGGPTIDCSQPITLTFGSQAMPGCNVSLPTIVVSAA